MLRAGRQRGFTLIEALVTISILALLMALMAPSMAEWIRGTHVRNLAESMQAGLQKARMEALRRNKIVTFWMVSSNAGGSLDDSCALASNSGSWVISLEDPSSHCSTAASATASPKIVETYGAGVSAALMSVSGLTGNGAAAANSVSFNGYGQTLPSATALGIIDITHTQPGARRLRLTVSSGGSVRMCDRDVTSGPTVCPP
ncbi:MAG: pilus assembly protein FimT [Ramlibacter sp.]|nr:pilus assembly protein FimT [Ramlibacter sp.]